MKKSVLALTLISSAVLGMEDEQRPQQPPTIIIRASEEDWARLKAIVRALENQTEMIARLVPKEDIVNEEPKKNDENTEG